jgi:pimeloyl-ACP methyl ester carboxylesterase
LKLFYREYGNGKPLLIAHGLFGMSDNWIEIAKLLSVTFKVYLLDLRNHGQSPHHPVHTYEVMSEDIKEFLTDRQIEKASFIGHSMGGKLMMYFSNLYPENVEKLIVVDISPKAYHEDERVNIKFGNHMQILNLMSEIEQAELSERSEISGLLNLRVENDFVRQIIRKNIYKNTDNLYKIKINLNALIKYFDTVGDEIGIEENLQFVDIVFIFGSESPYFRKEDVHYIREKLPFAQIEILKDAGHMMHIDSKENFVRMLHDFLMKK